MIDLHTHSTASDGSLTPRELARAGKAAGLTLMALTDHDNVSGLADFIDEAAAVGLDALSGIELSADVSAGQLHIVGLGIDPADPVLAGFCERILSGRAERNERILRAFADEGIPLTREEVASFAGEDLISRVHFAQALLARGLVASVAEAFERYLGKGALCYRDRYRPSPAECIERIHAAHGLAVMAHPFTLEPDPAALGERVAALRTLGLDGIECYYSAYGTGQTLDLLRIASRNGLFPSAGSDFHGTPKPDICLGALPVPEATCALLRERLGF